MGIGDWGLGIGDWGLGPIPNPQSQSPIPNPHVDNNFDYMKKIKNISELFDKINEPTNEEKKGTLI